MDGNNEHPLIRRLGIDDIDRIYEIEQLAYPFPWSRGIFEDCLRVGYICFGLQVGKVLAGYTILSWGAGEAHLLNLCIHPDWQSRGYGSLLLEYAINQVARLRVRQFCSKYARVIHVLQDCTKTGASGSLVAELHITRPVTNVRTQLSCVWNCDQNPILFKEQTAERPLVTQFFKFCDLCLETRYLCFVCGQTLVFLFNHGRRRIINKPAVTQFAF